MATYLNSPVRTCACEPAISAMRFVTRLPLQVQDSLAAVCAPDSTIFLMPKIVSLNRPILESHDELMRVVRAKAQGRDCARMLEVLAIGWVSFPQIP